MATETRSTAELAQELDERAWGDHLDWSDAQLMREAAARLRELEQQKGALIRGLSMLAEGPDTEP